MAILSVTGTKSQGAKSRDSNLSAERIVSSTTSEPSTITIASRHHPVTWIRATQPDPFRRYLGAPLIQLPLPESGRTMPYWQLYVADGLEPAPLSVESVSLFFRYSLSLIAWKRFHDNAWSLRANPSSGNLHPTKGYAYSPGLAGFTNIRVYTTTRRSSMVSSVELRLNPRFGPS